MDQPPEKMGSARRSRPVRSTGPADDLALQLDDRLATGEDWSNSSNGMPPSMLGSTDL